MSVKLLTKHHLEVLSLTGGCRGSSESTLVKMSNCWKSHATTHMLYYIVWCGLIWYGMAWYGTAVTVRYGTVRYYVVGYRLATSLISYSFFINDNFILK